MALDEALADSVRAGGLPFLRFYTWEPATLSLGRFQHPEAGLGPGARTVPRVRRLTGGGAIWHDSELTYSLGCRQDDLGLTGVKPSFERLCGFLVDTWRSLGWEAGFAKDSHTSDSPSLGTYTPACFAGQEAYDVMVSGRKLGGNAQKRDRDTIFQHGSIPLRLHQDHLEALFQPGFRPDAGKTTDLVSCGWTRPLEDLIPLLAEHFARRLGIAWEPTTPSSEERARAEALVTNRYANQGWTETGGGSLREPVGDAAATG